MHAHAGNIPPDLRAQIQECWRAGVEAADPRRAVSRALEGMDRGGGGWHVLAMGKAAPAMAEAAVAWLAGCGGAPAGGIIIAPDDALAGGAPLPRATGDHPTPGAASWEAAERLDAAVRAVGSDDAVLVLLSGGTSSLVASPAPGVTRDELTELWRTLLASGADIHVMNAVRRRFTRWGGGRLARALAPRRIEVLAISDVPGDDLAAIGSGPCAGDPLEPADVIALLAERGLISSIPARLRALLERGAPAIATVPPGDDVLRPVRTRVVAANADAVAAAARRAAGLGWDVRIHPEPVTGHAADAGRAIAAELLSARPRAGAIGACIVAGGETTVALTGGAADRDERGGRCQELALAAAEVFAARAAGSTSLLLAAGTDGRDGPTDAAGAMVDGQTWERMESCGAEPRLALAQHRSYSALAAAGALFRSGPTGTNVMDLMIGLRVVRAAGSEVASQQNGDIDPSD